MLTAPSKAALSPKSESQLALADTALFCARTSMQMGGSPPTHCAGRPLLSSVPTPSTVVSLIVISSSDGSASLLPT